MGRRTTSVDTTVVRRCPVGHPLVVRCHPLRAERGGPEPFPTLYWLACDAVGRQIARVEYEGGVAAIERRIAEDAALRERVHADHEAYVRERWELLTAEERQALGAAGRAAALTERGIGGIANRDAVKCLHLHYAHHLARGSAIGREIEMLASITLCGAGTRTLRAEP